jgi:hypothetical protein
VDSARECIGKAGGAGVAGAEAVGLLPGHELRGVQPV